MLGMRPGRLALALMKRGLVEMLEEQTEAMATGNELEATVMEMFERRTGRRLWRCGKLLRSTLYPWLGATLDYNQEDPVRRLGVLECKTTGAASRWPEDEEPAAEWQAQLQQQLVVTGRAWGSIGALIGSPYLHFRHDDFARHAEFCELLIEQTREFHEQVQSGDLPASDASFTDSRALRHVVEVLAGQSVVLPDEATEWDAALARVRAEIGVLETEKRRLENLFMAKIGQASLGVLPGRRGMYSLKTQVRKAYSVAETSFRVLRREEP